ncbi:hypothetical protein LX36DRAFT_257439 [Colletotrichum falcatum]|nr:hypothetical protein LX36DRAFT_257439 [Colletotrichum falcatum]
MDFCAKPPRVSRLRQVLNVVGCLCIFPLYRAAGIYTRYPAVVDLLISILFAEYCRFSNEGRRIALKMSEEVPQDLLPDGDDKEAQIGFGPIWAAGPSCDAVAMIVGWREDPDLWRRCLESYKAASGWTFMVVGIDGDGADDQEMINVFRESYPEQSCVLHVDEPLGEVATAYWAQEYAERRKWGEVQVDEDDVNQVVMRRCMDMAQWHLEKHVELGGNIKHLLLHQRHLHKKGIMFTSLVYSMVIAERLGVQFVWTSDSDSMVRPDSVEGTIGTMASDPGAGGASSGMVIHNADDSLVARLSASVYWCDQYLTHALPASVGVSDCQSGPSAAFRISAIRPVLVSWYNQRVFGKRMVANEDRHLTTLLLSRGWRVVYAGDIMTETENPTTFVRWAQQQVRWARAQHIETLLPLKVYMVSHPFLFFSALRRELTLLTIFTQCFAYLLLDKQLLHFNMADFGLQIGGKALYSLLRSPEGMQSALASALWIVPGMLFYNVPQPMVHAWGLMTLTADTWGTSMRSGSERAKRDGLRKRWYESGFLVVWMGVIGALFAKWASVRLHLIPEQRLLAMAGTALLCSFLMWRLVINYR